VSHNGDETLTGMPREQLGRRQEPCEGTRLSHPGRRTVRDGASRLARTGRADAQRARRSDRPTADHSKRDTVLAAVKAWPVGCGVRSTGGATAILDRGPGLPPGRRRQIVKCSACGLVATHTFDLKQGDVPEV
jgi:hypothetical protein